MVQRYQHYNLIFLGLVTFPKFSVPRINSTTIWHNYTIFFATLKGRFESFLLLVYNVIFFCGAATQRGSWPSHS
jgi:hypothetical protein